MTDRVRDASAAWRLIWWLDCIDSYWSAVLSYTEFLHFWPFTDSHRIRDSCLLHIPCVRSTPVLRLTCDHFMGKASNSAFHPFGVSKWVVIHVITRITWVETIKNGRTELVWLFHLQARGQLAPYLSIYLLCILYNSTQKIKRLRNT